MQQPQNQKHTWSTEVIIFHPPQFNANILLYLDNKKFVAFQYFRDVLGKPTARGFLFLHVFENQVERLFLKIPLNAFFDVSDANFCLPRIRSRPRHFPRLKTQITSSWENRLSWATSSRGAIPIENLAHFHEQPARQTAKFSHPYGNPGFKAENRLAFLPENKNRPFQRSKNRPIWEDKKAKFTLRKIPGNGQLAVRRVLVETQFYGHSRISVKA